VSRGLPACARAIGRSRRRGALTGACAATVALVLAGCGASSSSGGSASTVSGSTLDIVASQPPGSAGGQVATDVLNAERLAFGQSGGKAGPFQLRFVPVHGSEVSADARRAVSDTKAIAYIGETAPGTSGVSIQITNELGMLQVSPADTAAYLTQSTPGGGAPPGHYYPASGTYGRTFARLAPTTAAEASAIVSRMRVQKLTNIDVEHDATPYGASVAAELTADARKAGMTVTTGSATPAAKAVFYAGLPGTAAAHALDVAASTAPNATLFAPSALYDDTFVHGLSAAAQHTLTVSAPGVPSGSLDAVGRGFESDFTHHFGHRPAPQAIFGYEAMRALIATLQKAGKQAGARTTIVTDFRRLSRSANESALGAYTLRGGDSSLRSFVFARVSGGVLVPDKG
jgi:ABC-type branched-subunit amino acid transport system substrate-binding protein